MFKYLLIGMVVSIVFCETGMSQGKIREKLRRGAINNESNADSDKRNDFEGAVWEFKVIDRKEKDDTKKTKMTGRFRIKQSAVFSMGDVVTDEAKSENAADGIGDADSRSEAKKQARSLLKRRLDMAEEKDLGGQRIGDFSKKGKEAIIKFDEDDDYPLSGRVELKRDTKEKGGVWFGKYVEYLEGNKKVSWRMELRKIDE